MCRTCQGAQVLREFAKKSLRCCAETAVAGAPAAERVIWCSHAALCQLRSKATLVPVHGAARAQQSSSEASLRSLQSSIAWPEIVDELDECGEVFFPVRCWFLLTAKA